MYKNLPVNMYKNSKKKKHLTQYFAYYSKPFIWGSSFHRHCSFRKQLAFTVPIFQMETPRRRKVEELAQGHTVRKWLQSQCSLT